MIGVCAALAALLAGVAVVYRWIFVVGWLVRGHTLRGAEPPETRPRFAVLMPAHDEEGVIGGALASIAAADQPADRLAVIVVADNCSDGTAEIARAAGARVLERDDPDNPGKGQALAWALAQTDLSEFDAVAFVDADNLVTPGFFREMSGWIARGARVLQGYDGTANPDETPLTRLMAVTIVMKNLLYNGGKSALGLSPLLMGTGMVFTREVLEEHGWGAGSIGEDLEESFALLEAGERIRFVPDAEVQAQEAASLGQAYAQRQRWASSRAGLWGVATKALWRGIGRGDAALADAGLNLLMPTYSMSANICAMALMLGVLAASQTVWPLVVASVCAVAHGAEFALGLRIMRADARTLASVAMAPVFLVWKAVIDVLAAFGFRRDRWARTERHREL